MLLFPYADENPTRRFPIITTLLIILNALVFVVELRLASQGLLEARLQAWAVIPADLTNGLSQDDVLDLFRSMFLHGGWLHLLGNMLFLYLFGDNVEDAMGRLRYFLSYFAAGLASIAVQVWLMPDSRAPLIGASGAIAGALGAYLLLFPGAKVRTFLWLIIIFRTIRLPAWLLLGGWFLLQFYNAYSAPLANQAGGGVAYAAHVGGFAAGVLLALVFGRGGQA